VPDRRRNEHARRSLTSVACNFEGRPVCFPRSHGEFRRASSRIAGDIARRDLASIRTRALLSSLGTADASRQPAFIDCP
jgi:hypothetical protein